MTRQQFGVELRQYLTFVSPEQREQIVAYYDSLLEQVGPEGEFELFKQIGTPMTVAIAMKRHLEANEPLLPEDAANLPKAPTMVKFEQPAAPEDEAAPAAQVARPIGEPAPAEPAAAEEAPVEPAPVTEPAEAAPAEKPDEAAPADASDEAAPAETPEEAAPAETQEETAAPAATSAEPAPAKAPAEPAAPAAAVYEKPKMTFGRFLGAIGIGIVSVCIIAFFCCVTAVGGVLLVSGAQIFMTGLGITGYLTDCLMAVGVGAAIFGVGLLVAWFAIWCAIKLIGDMIGSFNKRPASEKKGLSSTWKLIWILVLIFVVAGAICAGVSLCMGGSLDTLTGSESFIKFLNRMTPSCYVDYFNTHAILG